MKHAGYLLLMVLTVTVCKPAPRPRSTNEQRRVFIDALTQSPSEEGIARRAKSNLFLQTNRIPFLAGLPVLPSAEETKTRNADEILDRSFALAVVALKGEGLDKEHLNELAKRLSAGDHFSPEERTYFNAATPTAAENSKFSWRYESLYILFWSLGFVDTLPVPRKPIDIGPIIERMRTQSVSELRKSARLRPTSELLDQADLVYRYHWAVVEKRVNPKIANVGLNEDVVMEWHHALNWLIRYMDDDWDNVSTDT